MPFLLNLEEFITLKDVEYGQDPPDFIFRHQSNEIGVELTDLVPKQFAKRGYTRKADFKEWKAEAKENPQPRHEFEWGDFTLRETLAAFENQFDTKIQKVKKWNQLFPEKWLLMHVASGSPFGGLVGGKRKDVPGHTVEVDDFYAKITYSLNLVCQRPHPFQYVILYSGMGFLALATSGRNNLSFPIPNTDTIARGAATSESFLDWRTTPTTILENPRLAPETKPGTEPT